MRIFAAQPRVTSHSLRMMSIEEFRAQNPSDWKQMIDQLFSVVPARAYWTNQEDIIRVLNHIGNLNHGNYTFFAAGGGLVLTGAKAGNEPGTIELRFGEHSPGRVCKPTYLLFDSFPSKTDYQWSYFRLETAPLTQTGVGYVRSYNHGQEEVLTELQPGKYDSPDIWEYRADREEKLPATARAVTRLLNGGVAIFQKSGAYNMARGTDSGLHAKFSPDDFKNHIDHARKHGADTLWTPPAL